MMKNRNERAPALAILVLVLFIVHASAAFAASGPAFPEPVGLVNDFAGVMSAAQKTQLESMLKDCQQTTGAEIAVVTLKSTQPMPAKDYAIQLMEKWKVGQKGKDNGIILLAAIDDRQVTIEVGYGLEGAITDAIAGRILDQDLIPRFRSNNYGAGLIAATQSLIVRVKQEAGVIPKTPGATTPTTPAKPPASAQSSAIVAVIIVAIALTMIMTAIARANRPRCPKCKGKCIVTDKVITPATALAAGVGVRVCKCLECGTETESRYRIPPIAIFGGRGWGGGGFGGGFGGRGGGFGGFGGGSSGGGGASRSW